MILQGGIVHTPQGSLLADIFIEKGVIVKIDPYTNTNSHTNIDPYGTPRGKSDKSAISTTSSAIASDTVVINCHGKHIIPGLIDAHVHFREPGQEYKEDFLSGSKAAAVGGVTTVLDMPNNVPPITTEERLREKRKLAQKSLVNYGFYVLGCRENVNNKADTLSSFTNIAGIKVYLGSSTGNYLTDNLGVFADILESSNNLVVVHAENEQLLRYFFDKHRETGLHHRMRDNVCAAVSVAEAATMANYFNKRLHIAHLSTKEEVEFLRKNKTPTITCEVSPHHLFLTEQFFLREKNYGKMNPPLRYQHDQEALWQGIQEGLIDIIATDHAPHLRQEKDKPFFDAPCGVPGVQTMLPLLLHAVNQGRITLPRMIELCSTNPARIFGIRNKGKIDVGYDADLCVVDLQKEGTIRNEDQLSKCGWTPFQGMTIKGWPVMTIVNGYVVYGDRIINDDCRGQETGKEVQFEEVQSYV